MPEIKAEINVPNGNVCYYDSGCSCQYLARYIGIKRGWWWCKVFDNERIKGFMKCKACLEACEEANQS